MNQPIIQELMGTYRASSLRKRDVLREILQQSALLGLARHNFFEHAAFYGETALRILYGLERLSEDLDFSLLKPNPRFNFSPFLEGMKSEMTSFGFHVDVEWNFKEKESAISSAFLKANTLKLLLTIGEAVVHKGVHPDEKITIKFNIDTNPPPGFRIETKTVVNPVPFYVVSYHPSDLFAGKMHAILYRAWKRRVKGRDWFDLIWYLKKGIPLHLTYLEKSMKQAGHLPAGDKLDREILLSLLKQKISMIDWNQAKSDVQPFVYDPKQLDLWSAKLFSELILQLRTEH